MKTILLYSIFQFLCHDKIKRFLYTRNMIIHKLLNLRLNSVDFGLLKSLSTKNVHSRFVYCLLKLYEGSFCSGSADNTIVIWKKIGDEYLNIQRLSDHTSYVYSFVNLSNKGFGTFDTFDSFDSFDTLDTFASGSGDKTIIIWKKEKDSYAKLQQLQGHTSSVDALEKISKDCFCSGSYDGTLIIWKKANNFYVIQQEIESKIPKVFISCLLYFNDEMFFSGISDKLILIWKLDKITNSYHNFQKLDNHNGTVKKMIKLNEKKICSSSYDHTIIIWKIVKDSIIEIQKLTSHTNSVDCICKLSDKLFCSGSWDRSIIMWIENNDNYFIPYRTFNEHSSIVNSLCQISENEFCSCSDDFSIKIYEFSKSI